VTPDSLDLLCGVQRETPIPIAAGERLYTLPEFYRLISLRAADIVQPDIAHCGGIQATKKIAAMAATQDLSIAPHCSIGPVALAAALHVAWSTPNVAIQETFADYDVPWRTDLVNGWNPLRHGEFGLPERPGIGLELDDDVLADHPYRANSFPSLWEESWLTNFTQHESPPPR
jgi:galactonate dehydratase